jgi:hypothetical protein
MFHIEPNSNYLLAWCLRHLFSFNFCNHGGGGAAVDPAIQTGRPINFTHQNVKSSSLNLHAEDIWKK